MTLQHMGRSSIASLVRRHVALAHRLADAVDAAPDLERVTPVELSVVCFRYVPPGRMGDAAWLDALNKALVERIQAEGRAFLTGTVLRGRFHAPRLRAPLRDDRDGRGRPGRRRAGDGRPPRRRLIPGPVGARSTQGRWEDRLGAAAPAPAPRRRCWRTSGG